MSDTGLTVISRAREMNGYENPMMRNTTYTIHDSEKLGVNMSASRSDDVITDTTERYDTLCLILPQSESEKNSTTEQASIPRSTLSISRGRKSSAIENIERNTAIAIKNVY